MAAEFALLAVLILASAFFAGAETVFFSLSRSDLAHFRRSKEPLHKGLTRVLSRPKDFIVTILCGNELANIAISMIIAGIFYHFLGGHLDFKTLTLLSVAVGTFLILIFGEIVPKSIGVLHAKTLLPLVVFLLRPLYTLLKPVRFLLVKLSNGIIRLVGSGRVQETPMIVEEEFRTLLELGAESGQVGRQEEEMIRMAFAFGNKIVSQIMTPKEKMFCLPHDIGYDDFLEQVRATQYSRIPVYENDPANIIGLFYTKDLFRHVRRKKEEEAFEFKNIVRPLLFVSGEESLARLFDRIRETRIHMAIVTDEKNRPVGLVTMHDLVEEIFGEVEE